MVPVRNNNLIKKVQKDLSSTSYRSFELYFFQNGEDRPAKSKGEYAGRF